MKLLYKLSIIIILVILIGMVVWCMRKKSVEKFEENTTKSIIASFSKTVDQMLMRQAMDDVEDPDDETNENNSV